MKLKRRAAHGYEATREAAMAAFAKSWRRNKRAFDSSKASMGKEPRQRGQRGQVLRGVGYIHPPR
jgi:hypothetical protein